MTNDPSQPLTASLAPSQAHRPYEAPTTAGRLTGALTGLTGPLLAVGDPTHAHSARGSSMPTPGPFTPTLLSQALTASLTPWTPHASQQSHEPTGRLTRPSAALTDPLPSLPSPTRARCEPGRPSGTLDIPLTGLLARSGAHCRCSRENHASRDAHRDPRQRRRHPRHAQQASCGGAKGASNSGLSGNSTQNFGKGRLNSFRALRMMCSLQRASSTKARL